MTEKKKIPCRVCGKLFEPCATCQSDNRMFRWRNFACSLKCAEKYISETITYRESLKHKDEKTTEIMMSDKVNTEENSTKSDTTPKRKYTKKITKEITKNDIENNETE